MNDLNGDQPGQRDFVDQQTAAAGGVDAVEAYEDATGAARGEDVRADQGDDDFDDADADADADEDEDGDDFDDEDEEDDEDIDDEDDLDEDDAEDLRIDDDGNPMAR